MRKMIILGFAWLFGLEAASGQSAFRFRSSESAGVSNGQLGGNFMLQTIDGIARGPWFVGGGAGLDYYRFRSVPLFVSASRDLSLTKRDGLGIFLNVGANLPWQQGGGSPNSGVMSLSGGEFWSGGMSYILKLGEHTQKAILFSAGYEIKKMSARIKSEILSPCYNYGGCQIDQTIYYQYLNRMFFLMAGFRF